MPFLLFYRAPPVLPPVVAAPSTESDAYAFFAWGNVSDTALLSGGSWVPSLPLDNMKNRTLARVARSTDASPASTWFKVDLGPDRRYRAIALRNHNFALDAKYRIRGSSVSSFASLEFDTGWQAVWPAVYNEDELEFGDLNWFEGTYTEQQRQGYIWDLIHRLADTSDARYLWIEIDDQANEASYSQIGRLFVADGWTPSHNMEVGASLGIEDDSEIQRAQSGAEYFNVLDRNRVVRLTIPYISQDEAYSQAFELMRQMGITGEVLFQFNGADTKHKIRRSFVGRLRQISAVEHVTAFDTSVAFELQESPR